MLIGKWTKYGGFRVAMPAKRAAISEDETGERLYAYVEHAGERFRAWYEVKRPGQIEDKEIGIFDTAREAYAAVRAYFGGAR